MAGRVEAERQAAKLLTRRPTDTPIDVEAVATEHGAVVLRQSLEKGVSGVLIRQAAVALIGVNSSQHPRRQRFTIAHELGHLTLHPGRSYTVDSTVRLNWRNDLSSLATDTEEIEANAFAAALLMPADLVRHEVGALRAKDGTDPSQVTEVLAKKFEVSTEAMGYQLVNLGINT